MTLQVTVLAAGSASRFGAPKQLAKFQGEPMLQRALVRASAVGAHVVSVVLGAHAQEIVATLGPGSATLVVNRDWAEGIASSIRAAVQALPGSCSALMLLLADQPLVTAENLKTLVQAWRRQRRHIIASQYGAVTGVPVIFPRWCFADLLALRGDQGARVVLRRYPDNVVRIANPEAEVDIDYPGDLDELVLRGATPDAGEPI
jgi:molybdenum cofactor cytidylyltransferase